MLVDSTQSAIPATDITELAPSYRLPLALVALAIPLFWLQPWVSGAVALLGLLLLFQAVTLRLQFSSTALDIYRGEQRIRHFPYQDWLNWEIFWSPLPILFYFKEVSSIHFLPIIFSPSQLRTCLEQHCPRPIQTS
ncbi:MAG: DUF3119 family protein [Cyanobacteria bacterium Co-bin13]|nr:DUF3119 family protein [Cyanobacteria bacterium Co-bin13]